MTEDMRATGVTDADLAAWDWELTGAFADANHPDAPPVRLSVDGGGVGTQLTIAGGFDAEGRPGWTASATLNPQSGTLLADFSAKGGPGALRGQATTELPEAFSKGGVPGIMWEDGNVWERVE